MYMITLWNKHSTDFNRTEWHRRHGTECITTEAKHEAFSIIHDRKIGTGISHATIAGPLGYLSTWSYDQRNEQLLE